MFSKVFLLEEFFRGMFSFFFSEVSFFVSDVFSQTGFFFQVFSIF